MGRGEELSDFQRGTVVGCYLCKKSIREISALLNLPRSTISSVILKWKRGGITTALPRSGRPHKLKEQDRQVLEKVAMEKSLPSIEALTAEFQTASGANVSATTIRRELHEMGFRGRVSSYSKPKGGQKVAKKPGSPDQEDEKMQNRLVVVLCNLKPVKTRGMMNQAVIMCASSPEKMEILDPPSGAEPGDRVTIQGFPGEPDRELNPKKRVWEEVQPDLRTDSQCVATYKGAAFEVVGKGVCKSQTMSDCEIK
ncbi:uncharacterized protein LOC111568838 isoform X2 [Amphiprion ocellaris]|uniref:uncharacterized protein LOC111568838 isoform X2 n=1 Tax=Amphiprion ocellaris TaxID=80972 RepID=UPI0024110085|nr:uncharacterized protein LOC111568838 isoform X2 [Amphiprion ocellaris]